jgi:hypothetical protein
MELKNTTSIRKCLCSSSVDYCFHWLWYDIMFLDKMKFVSKMTFYIIKLAVVYFQNDQSSYSCHHFSSLE